MVAAYSALSSAVNNSGASSHFSQLKKEGVYQTFESLTQHTEIPGCSLCMLLIAAFYCLMVF
jgi:aconitase B